MNTRRKLHCVFYSNVLDIYKLDIDKLVEVDSHVLVELAVGSNLSVLFKRQHKTENGLAALLRNQACLHKLARRYRNIPAPLILAPNPPVPSAAIVSALSLLGSAPGPYDQATIVVNINDAHKFINAYDYMDKFSIVWDICDYPNLSLQTLAEILTNNQLISSQRWNGLYLVNHRETPLPDDHDRELALQAVLNEFSVLFNAT